MVLRPLALAAALLAGGARAETVVQTGPAWRGELRFDDRAARWPGLDALLRETAMAGLDDFAAEASESDAQPGRPWGYWVADTVTFEGERWVSFVRVTSYDTGGAHPNHAVEALIWDDQAGDFVWLDRFVDLEAVGPALTEHLRAEIARVVHGGPPDAFWRGDIEVATEVDTLSAVSLVPSTEAGRAAGVDVHFSPYEVGPYSAGAPAIRVPWRLFGDALTPEGAALFGGEPAPGG